MFCATLAVLLQHPGFAHATPPANSEASLDIFGSGVEDTSSDTGGSSDVGHYLTGAVAMDIDVDSSGDDERPENVGNCSAAITNPGSALAAAVAAVLADDDDNANLKSEPKSTGSALAHGNIHHYYEWLERNAASAGAQPLDNFAKAIAHMPPQFVTLEQVVASSADGEVSGPFGGENASSVLYNNEPEDEMDTQSNRTLPEAASTQVPNSIVIDSIVSQVIIVANQPMTAAHRAFEAGHIAATASDEATAATERVHAAMRYVQDRRPIPSNLHTTVNNHAPPPPSPPDPTPTTSAGSALATAVGAPGPPLQLGVASKAKISTKAPPVQPPAKTQGLPATGPPAKGPGPPAKGPPRLLTMPANQQPKAPPPVLARDWIHTGAGGTGDTAGIESASGLAKATT